MFVFYLVKVKNPCVEAVCGPYTECKVVADRAVCTCRPGYFGSPESGCRPECTTNSDCPSVKACINQHCKDPCPGTCGADAECSVKNHAPLCRCQPGYEGNPAIGCRLKPRKYSSTCYMFVKCFSAFIQLRIEKI